MFHSTKASSDDRHPHPPVRGSRRRLGLGTPAWRAAGLRALQAVLDNIGPDGTVQNVSYGTRMGHDLDFYRVIPIQPTGYGQALAILCLGEGLHHCEPVEPAKVLS